jgi:hypothetical protein
LVAVELQTGNALDDPAVNAPSMRCRRTNVRGMLDFVLKAPLDVRVHVSGLEIDSA